MRAIVGLCAVMLVTGCASRGTVAPPEPPDPAPPMPESAPASEVPMVEPEEPAAAPFEAECLQAARLSEVGEHKPAVDGLDSVLQAGGTCPDIVLETVKDSQQRLTDADELTRRGLEARRAGDFALARESFQLALVAYPKYYWVQKLLQDLPDEESRQITALRETAAERLSSGRPDEALELLEQAARLPSPGPEVAEEIARTRTRIAVTRLNEARHAQQAGDVPRAIERSKEAIAARPSRPVVDEVVDFARRLGLSLFSSGELVAARDLWQAALSLDQTNGLLRQYLDEVQERLQNLEAIRDDGN